jgi:hypothetical protein
MALNSKNINNINVLHLNVLDFIQCSMRQSEYNWNCEWRYPWHLHASTADHLLCRGPIRRSIVLFAVVWMPKPLRAVQREGSGRRRDGRSVAAKGAKSFAQLKGEANDPDQQQNHSSVLSRASPPFETAQGLHSPQGLARRGRTLFKTEINHGRVRSRLAERASGNNEERGGAASKPTTAGARHILRPRSASATGSGATVAHHSGAATALALASRSGRDRAPAWFRD